MSHSKATKEPDLQRIADDDLDEESTQRLLKDLFPPPVDPLTMGLERGADFKHIQLAHRTPKGTQALNAYQALSDTARRQFLSHFFIEVEVPTATGHSQHFFVSEFDAKTIENWGGKRVAESSNRRMV